MTVPVVICALLFWVAVFLIYFTSQGTTPTEFFFGHFEPLPETLGTWRQVAIDPKTGLLREERLLLPDGQATSPHLLCQVRLRDPATRAIVSIEPDHRIRRRRISAR